MSTPITTDPQPQDPWDNPLHERYKTRPVYADIDYAHLADLNYFLQQQGTTDTLIILDYGAGASPYRSYFPKADYRRADITGADYLRYHIGEDSRIDETDETFDLILSTQVAEHLPSPRAYFEESLRLLKKGGRLIITTHGIWEEHGSPNDFQRWTAAGLERDLRKAGFTGIQTFKLTCGLRGMFLVFTRLLFATPPPSSAISAFVFKAFRTVFSKIFPLLYRLADRWWPQDRIVPCQGEAKTPIWYLDIAAIAMK